MNREDGAPHRESATTRPWYADWRVWFCFGVLTLWWIVERVVGLPFRMFDWIWNLLF